MCVRFAVDFVLVDFAVQIYVYGIVFIFTFVYEYVEGNLKDKSFYGV